MSIILGASILIRLAALVWSVWLLRRVRDGRMAFLSIMLALMALRQILTLQASGWSGGLSFEQFGTEWPGLLVSIMALGAVIALGRLLREHKQFSEDQAEQLARERVAHADVKTAWQERSALLERISDGFVALDANWCYIYVNQHAAEMLGRRPEDLIGKHIWTEYPEGVGQSFHKAYYEATETQQYVYLEEYYPPWDRWFENHIYPSPEGLSIFFHEITEQKQTQREMQLLAQSVRSTNDIVCISDQEDRIIFVNQALLDTYGYQREELIGHPVTMLRHPDFPPAEDPLTVSYEERENWQGEFWNAAKDGTPILLALSSTTVRDEAGEAVAYVGVAKDITQQRAAETALAQSETRLAEAQRIARLGSYEVDLRTDTLYWSDTMYDIFGLDPDEQHGSMSEVVARLVHPEDMNLSQEAVRRRIDTGDPIDSTYRIIRTDGAVRMIHTRGRCIYDADGEPVLLKGTVQDVTELREKKDALQRTAQRLEGLHAIDQALLRAQTPEAIARLALPHLRALVPAERVSVALFDKDEKNAVILAVDEAPEFESQFGAGTIVPAAVFRKLLSEDPCALVYDADLASAHQDASVVAFMLEGWRSSVRAPLCQQGRVIGTLNVADQRTEAFNEEHLAIVREVADQLSIALYSARLMEETVASRERLRQLSRKLVEVQEDERRHLALELHDEVGQMLTALRLAADLPDADHTLASKAACDEVWRLVDLLTQRVRNLSLELRPSMLDDLGLLPALLWHVRRFTEQSQIAVDFSHAGLDQQRFEGMTETTAYRIVQEALTNVARHAGVGTVSVSVRTEGAVLVIEIEDKGAGFDPDMLKFSSHTAGLSGMAERAELAGGKLSYTAVPGEGVSIRVVLPAFATVAVD